MSRLLTIFKGERTQFDPTAGDNGKVVRAVRIEQRVFDVRPRFGFQPLPLVDRDKDSGFHSAARDDLRAVFERGVEEFAEAGFCVVDLPDHGDGASTYSHMTSHMTMSRGERMRQTPSARRASVHRNGQCYQPRVWRSCDSSMDAGG